MCLAFNDAEQPSHGWRAQVDCVQQSALCREHHITGFPSIRVFRSGHDDITVHGMRDHEVPAHVYNQASHAPLQEQEHLTKSTSPVCVKAALYSRCAYMSDCAGILGLACHSST